MAPEYANQPVVFLEYDVTTTPYNTRDNYWWAANTGTTPSYPLVMTDSGNNSSYGYEDFATKYRAMVDASLARPAKALLTASSQRVGDTLHFTVQITNNSGVSLGPTNSGRVWALVYEVFATAPNPGVRLTKRVVRAASWKELSPDLYNGATRTFTIDTPTLSGVVWGNLQWIVLADYRPGGSSGAYDMLQAISSLDQSNAYLLWTK